MGNLNIQTSAMQCIVLSLTKFGYDILENTDTPCTKQQYSKCFVYTKLHSKPTKVILKFGGGGRWKWYRMALVEHFKSEDMPNQSGLKTC